MTDEQLADAVLNAAHNLNAAIEAARGRGLRVDVEIVEHFPLLRNPPTKVIHPTVFRRLSPLGPQK